ncbi:LD-carboxypeptidase [Verrucosispora sp. WMMD573]|uniref:LD-carboxypeptidase n=1 Tax=Verrucosispora sp. WMMD573 TaxID=3015149 RepID=UPI00248B2455|nr:LD-carboxypeptidase [Verrucosispora sp. WMMD573]WBB53721.1 LD-carboxypeptidase [Verrucosispora sp. WMMD573]
MTAPTTSPPPVGPGAHIRVVSPAMASLAQLPGRTRRAMDAAIQAGYRVTFATNAFALADDGVTAGLPEERASDLMEAFDDPTVDVVLAADAGSATRHLLPLLDPAVFARRPKPFVGFCDNVFINQFLASRVGLGSLYGATFLGHFGEGGSPFPETLAGLGAALDTAAPLACAPVGRRTGEFLNWHLTDRNETPRGRWVDGGCTWLRPGTSSGVLVGGELTLVGPLVETFDLDLTGTVLLWHNAHRSPEPERTFADLCTRLDLSRVAGMVIGTHPEIPPAQWAARCADLLDELLPGISYPVVVNADIGHVDPSWVVRYGQRVRLDSGGPLLFMEGNRVE